MVRGGRPPYPQNEALNEKSILDPHAEHANKLFEIMKGWVYFECISDKNNSELITRKLT